MEVREPSAKYLAHTGYKQTEVGAIPEDWECVVIGAAIDLMTGFPFPSSGYARSGVRLLRGFNVKRGVTDWSEDGTEYWPSIRSEIRKYVLKAGDVVIAMDGSLVGRSFAMLSANDVPALLLQRVARIRSEVIAQDFLKAWICSERFTEHCDAVKTVTAIPHISPADIRSFKIALPPTKAEQEAIAEALSDADALIESLEQLLAKKRHLKQGAMQELLTGKKRLPGFSGSGLKNSEIGEVPRDWEVVEIGKIASVKTGPFGSSLHERDYVDDGTPIITVEHLGERGVVHTNLPMVSNADRKRLSAYSLEEGDIVFSRVGSVDRNARVSMAEHGWLFSGRLLRLRRLAGNVDMHYLSYHFHFEPFKQRVRTLAVGQTMASLNTQILKSVLIILPPPFEQTAIAAILSDMDAEIAALEGKLAKARNLKQGMMQELLTGRIRLV